MISGIESSEKEIATHILPPAESKKAYQQAVGHLKAGNGSISYFHYRSKDTLQQFELVCLPSDSQYRVYLIQKTKPLGEGAQGCVYLSQELFSSSQENQADHLAVVKISQNKSMNDEDFKTEMAILKHLNRFRGYGRLNFETNEHQYLFSQFCAGTDLLKCLYEKRFNRLIKRHLSPLVKVKMIRAILMNMQELHQQHGVLHRDIKAENIIIDSQLKAQLIDFGTSCLIQKSNKTFVGTIGYQAPETILDKAKRPIYSLATEYFSVGVVLAEILSTKNYQAVISKCMLESKKKNELSFISLDTISHAMPDVFKDPQTCEDDWISLPCSIIKQLTHPNVNLRPQYKQIDNMIIQLKKLEDKLEEEIPKTPRSARELKTSLRRAQNESPEHSDLIAELESLQLTKKNRKSEKNYHSSASKRNRAPSSSMMAAARINNPRQRSFSSSVPILDMRRMQEEEQDNKQTSPSRHSFPFSPRSFTSSLKMFSPRKSPKTSPHHEDNDATKDLELKRHSYSRKKH